MLGLSAIMEADTRTFWYMKSSLLGLMCGAGILSLGYSLYGSGRSALWLVLMGPIIGAAYVWIADALVGSGMISACIFFGIGFIFTVLCITGGGREQSSTTA
tara:strand:- start:229 stop:534 length:306 start_codon:yes stop_codon:yes gene_type:complete